MQRQRLGNIITGISLIFIGASFGLQKLGFIDLHLGELGWPLVLLIPAIAFHLGFLLSGMKAKYAGLLVPGGILLVLSLHFYFEIFTNYQFSMYTWPNFLLAPAFGLLELWFFGGRNKGLLIPVGILSVLAIFFYAQTFISTIWPIFIIIIGLYLLFGRKK